MRRTVVSFTFLSLMLPVCAPAITALTSDTIAVGTTAAATDRLLAANPVVPDCGDTGATVRLDWKGSVPALSTATLSASLSIRLGPTVKAGDRIQNVFQGFSGSLSTESRGSSLSWRFRSYNGGPFLGHSVASGSRVVFVLPSRFESVGGEESDIYAVLAIACSTAGGQLSCSEGRFLFENAFPSVFGSSRDSSFLFDETVREEVREAARARSTKAVAGPLLDCCYSTWYCGCYPCEPGPWYQEDCPLHCSNCVPDECYSCEFIGCQLCF